MSAAVLDHADTLLYGENVLHQVLAPEVPFRKIPEVLRRNPLEGIDIKLVPLDRREGLLDAAEDLYIPGAPGLEVFSGMQQLFHRSLAGCIPCGKHGSFMSIESALLDRASNYGISPN